MKKIYINLALISILIIILSYFIYDIITPVQNVLIGDFTRYSNAIDLLWLKIAIIILLIILIAVLVSWYIYKIIKGRIAEEENKRYWKEKELLSEQLIEKGKEYEELFENNPMPMWVYDLETLKFLLVNNAAVNHYGYTKEEFLSMTIRDIRPEEEIKKLELNLAQPEKEIEKSNTWLHKKKDGTLIHVEINSHRMPVKNGVRSRLVMARDVSEKYLLNQKIKESENKYREIVDQALIGIISTSYDGNIIYANNKACEMLQYTSAEILSINISDTYTEEEYFISRERLKAIHEKGEIFYQRRMKKKDGSYFYAEFILSKLDEGRSQALFYDISERKKTELQLNKIYRIVEQNPLAIVVINNNGEIEYANTVYLDSIKRNKYEIEGKKFIDLETANLAGVEPVGYIDILSSNEDWKGEIKYKNINNEYQWELINTFTIRDTSGGIINRAVIKENITGRKKSEELSLLSETQFSSVWDNTSDALRITDENGIILRVNEEFCRLFNKKKNEVIGQPFCVIYKNNNVSSVEEYKELFKNKSITGTFETERVLWDNRNIWIELLNSFIEIENQPKILLSIFRDITNRKDVEKHLVEAKERAEELIKLKNNFLENMSHELRTPMIGILGFSQLLSVNLEDEENKNMAGYIYMGGKRLLRTMDMILDLSRIESDKLDIDLKEFDINEIISEEINLYKDEADNKKLTLDYKKPDYSVIIRLDERLFKQIIDNLLSNAVKFTNKGTITIEVFSDESFTIIKVADTGIGIDERDIDLIFSEFRQASEGFRRKYEGVGLGLSITKKFVEMMNGTISVESKPGEGSIFTLKFKKYNPAEDKTGYLTEKTPTLPEFISGKKKRILLVDDDESTIEIVCLTLKNICHIDSATSGESALEMINKFNYDLILMDIVLGYGMNGIETTKEIRKIKSYFDVPIIALTAYTMPEDKEKLFEEGLTHYISKPFELKMLREFIVNKLQNPH